MKLKIGDNIVFDKGNDKGLKGVVVDLDEESFSVQFNLTFTQIFPLLDIEDGLIVVRYVNGEMV